MIEMKSAYSRFILFNIMNCKEAERLVNKVMYMPVAVATYGSVPIINKPLTKINPGLVPEKEAIIAPKNDMAEMMKRLKVVPSKSPSVNSYPTSTFSL